MIPYFDLNLKWCGGYLREALMCGPVLIRRKPIFNISLKKLFSVSWKDLSVCGCWGQGQG